MKDVLMTMETLVAECKECARMAEELRLQVAKARTYMGDVQVLKDRMIEQGREEEAAALDQDDMDGLSTRLREMDEFAQKVRNQARDAVRSHDQARETARREVVRKKGEE